MAVGDLARTLGKAARWLATIYIHPATRLSLSYSGQFERYPLSLLQIFHLLGIDQVKSQPSHQTLVLRRALLF